MAAMLRHVSAGRDTGMTRVAIIKQFVGPAKIKAETVWTSRLKRTWFAGCNGGVWFVQVVETDPGRQRVNVCP